MTGRKQKRSSEKITMAKYVSIAEQMRNSQHYLLDISQYEPKEVEMIATLVQNDAIFNFCNEVKDMDVRKLQAIMEYLDAEEKMKIARAKF